MKYNKDFLFGGKFTERVEIHRPLSMQGTGTEFSGQGACACPYICIYSTRDHAQSGPASQRTVAEGVPTALTYALISNASID